MLVAVPSGASAATTIGETFKPVAPDCGADFTRLQSTSPGAKYAAPSAGVITRWSFEAAASNVPQLKFKVGRSAGGDMFTIIGESALVTPVAGALNSYFTQIPVQAGDVIGFYNATAGYCDRPDSDYTYHSSSGDVVPPNSAGFNFLSPYQLDLSALLEPDCDNDRLGDETQDKDISSCPAAGGATCKGNRATIIGTSGNDVRSGTPGRDVMVGQGGNDRLSGLAGNDVICGGAGRDTLKGGTGNDFLSGQKGKDKLAGQKGEDKLSGKKGKDLCVGGPGKDKAKGCEKTKSI